MFRSSYSILISAIEIARAHKVGPAFDLIKGEVGVNEVRHFHCSESAENFNASEGGFTKNFWGLTKKVLI